ncbi:hypothetical protein ASPZODRAFT_1499440 [Penicilliopsis zonata CBS 506.65]|uniref:Amine oxidase n=1 Tax=Penicilliopsis zonata CBS 506.65 TaxID=1073090 RepID=A0A1L9SQX2_9EURO|nr:hypothetical protein ASPZODRAFT_1499440 [Penicilliopsis zonata CBS 506.65]OJJ49494.1 hypothetical protein ASPZODRAFT_1499440 [Penicilliopsis zonata CBS 506.65]
MMIHLFFRFPFHFHFSLAPLVRPNDTWIFDMSLLDSSTSAVHRLGQRTISPSTKRYPDCYDGGREGFWPVNAVMKQSPDRRCLSVLLKYNHREPPSDIIYMDYDATHREDGHLSSLHNVFSSPLVWLRRKGKICLPLLRHCLLESHFHGMNLRDLEMSSSSPLR